MRADGLPSRQPIAGLPAGTTAIGVAGRLAGALFAMALVALALLMLMGAAAISVAAVSGAALAAPKVGEAVSVSACVRPGVEASCLMITGADGAVFNVTGANPKPPLDVTIELHGTVSDKLSACNQGVVLDRITWTASQQKCPSRQ